MYLETQRLILRKPGNQDVDDYLEFVNSEFVLHYNAMALYPGKRQKSNSPLPRMTAVCWQWN